jgi:hypothetical protein
MRLAKLDVWRHKVFAEDSMPSWHMALRWAKKGAIPGAVHMHGAWHVDLDVYEQAVASQTAASSNEVEKPETRGAGSALAQKLEGMG